MIIVFDASSLVGAVLRQGGIPEQALLEVVDQGTLVASREVIEEYRAVLRRPKFAAAVSAERREGVLDLIEVLAQRVEPTEPVDDCRDPGDNKYLALAAAAGADIIVSSDADLRVLDPWRGVRIVPPAQFLALIRSGAE